MKLVVDCDAGTDDSQAILMALASPHVNLLAITTTFGNAVVESTSINALRTLKVVNRLDVRSCPLFCVFFCVNSNNVQIRFGD